MPNLERGERRCMRSTAAQRNGRDAGGFDPAATRFLFSASGDNDSRAEHSGETACYRNTTQRRARRRVYEMCNRQRDVQSTSRARRGLQPGGNRQILALARPAVGAASGQRMTRERARGVQAAGRVRPTLTRSR
jgi:hypothetical protein